VGVGGRVEKVGGRVERRSGRRVGGGGSGDSGVRERELGGHVCGERTPEY